MCCAQPWGCKTPFAARVSGRELSVGLWIYVPLRDSTGGLSRFIWPFCPGDLSKLWLISTSEFVLSRLVSVLPARPKMPLKELFSVWVLYFAIFICEEWLWNLNKKGCFLTLTSRAVIPVILCPWGTETVNKLLCSVWHALSTLLTFFPLCKAVGSLSSVPALPQFVSVVSTLIYRVPLVSSNLSRITQPRSACRPRSWRSICICPSCERFLTC